MKHLNITDTTYIYTDNNLKIYLNIRICIRDVSDPKNIQESI